MIDKGGIIVEGHKTNDKHGAFKYPLPNYEKGESSSSNKGSKVNYVYDNVINHLSTSNSQVNVIKFKEKQENALVNVTTRAQAKVILKGTTSKTSPPPNQYSIVDQLQKTSI